MSGYLSITGNKPEEIGEQLGRYWGAYFSSLRRMREEGPRKLYRLYKGWLTSRRPDTIHLRRNTRNAFPEIWAEIGGMLNGINYYKKDLGFTATPDGLFACILAETDLSYKDYWGCSTVVLRTAGGYHMVHSDEYDEIGPLVIAEVDRKQGNQHHCFVSVSHAFQLFGSAVGLNNSFAFQGNSIPCSEATFEALRDTQNYLNRVPKTILSRKLLDLNELSEVKDLFLQHPSTLPNHQFIVTGRAAYSLQVKPIPDSEKDPTYAVVQKLKFDESPRHCQTNHFIEQASDPTRWAHKGNKESIARRNELSKYVAKATNGDDLERAFLRFLQHYPRTGRKLLRQTSGTLSFWIPKNGKPELTRATLQYGVPG